MEEFTVSKGPYIKDHNKTSNMMLHLLIALVPIILFSFYKNGIIPYTNSKTDIMGLFYPLILALIAAFSSFIFEFIFSILFLKKRGRELLNYIRSSYSIFPGLFLSLVLPINTPLAILIFGSFIATCIGKMLFGGFGKNIFNPALVGCLFVVSAYSSVILSNGGYLNSYEIDTISGATPLSNVSSMTIGTYETLVTPYGDLGDFFIGTIPGSLGETSALLCIIGFLYLTFFKVIKWKIPTVYILTVFAMTYIIGSINNLGIWYPLFQIFSGGLMFGAIFMATDPVTSPTTPIGQVIYGLFLGILTVVFRYLTPFPEGVLTSILTMNMFVFLIDKIGFKSRFKFNKCLAPFVIAWVLIISLSLMIAKSYDGNTTDSDFNILEKTITNNITTYTVTQKGRDGLITGVIVIEDNVVTSFVITKNYESFYSTLEKIDYLDTLLAEQKNLANVDTRTGATLTATALKQMLINTLADYGIKQSETTESSSTFKIDSKEIVEGRTNYYATNKSYGGLMHVKITIENNMVVLIEMIDYEDTCLYNKDASEDYECPMTIEAVDYFNTLLTNQNNIDSIDTVSGATMSSSALKEIVKKVLEDYGEE